jgi:hypothetical protein
MGCSSCSMEVRPIEPTLFEGQEKVQGSCTIHRITNQLEFTVSAQVDGRHWYLTPVISSHMRLGFTYIGKIWHEVHIFNGSFIVPFLDFDFCSNAVAIPLASVCLILFCTVICVQKPAVCSMRSMSYYRTRFPPTESRFWAC